MDTFSSFHQSMVGASVITDQPCAPGNHRRPCAKRRGWNPCGGGVFSVANCSQVAPRMVGAVRIRIGAFQLGSLVLPVPRLGRAQQRFLPVHVSICLINHTKAVDGPPSRRGAR
jgi:hypothetical protein